MNRTQNSANLESRRRKLQRFLVLPQFTFGNMWFPIVAYWLETYCPIGTMLYVAIAYTSAIIQGGEIKRMGVQKYDCRVKEAKRTQRRHSTFYVGLHGQRWVNSVEQYSESVAELMRLTPNKRKYYQQGLMAVELIKQTS